MQMTRQLPGETAHQQIVPFELDMNARGCGQGALRVHQR
jgi:hypothetical protein